MTAITTDRGAGLTRAADIARATRRCLALHGHVDDLLPTAAGSMLRLPELLAITGSRSGTTTIIASEADGMTTLIPPDTAQPAHSQNAPPGTLADLVDRALEQLPRTQHPTTLVLRNAHTALERDDLFGERLRDLPFDRRLSGSPVQIIATFRGPSAPGALRGATGWEIHHIGLPGRAERRAALDYWERISALDATTIDLDELAGVTGGLELDDVRRLAAEHARYKPLTKRRVSAVRSAALSRQLGHLVEVDHHPAVTFDHVVGGDAVKAAVRQARRDGRYMPMALVGPPGVGKTMLATAAARELAMPIAYVDGRLKGGIVGETARNLALFRELLIAYAPLVVFWDEVDLLLGRSTDYNGDSGASNEVRQAALTLIQDAPSLDIFVMASSNNPLSALQYRIRNRLRLIPVLHAVGDDAHAIARREAAKLGVRLADDAVEIFSADGVLWNGRDIARIIDSARVGVMLTRDLGLSHPPVLTADDLRLPARHFASASDATAELNALEAVFVTDNPYDLPWIARQIAGRPQAPPPPYLAGAIGPDGLPDRRELIADIADAAAWWATQETWRVSSSHTGGGVIAAFESGVVHAVGQDALALALPNATTALATALRALGICAGATIGVPSLDWNGTAATAHAAGTCTTPLPVAPQSGLLDTAYLARYPESTKGLAAVIAVHLHGLTCDVTALCDSNPALMIIEDAAQAWGAKYSDGKPVGSAGHACFFSFGATKSPSAGELGCLVTHSARAHQEAVALTQHPTRQLLTGIARPRRDQSMARVAPVVALLGAYAIHRHAAQTARLRQAATLVAAQLSDSGIAVLSDPALHAPGILCVRADVGIAQRALAQLTLGHDAVIAEVDRADLQVQPDVANGHALHELARAITVITIKLAPRQV